MGSAVEGAGVCGAATVRDRAAVICGISESAESMAIEELGYILGAPGLGHPVLCTRTRQLFAQEVAGDEKDVGGALGETAHKVRVPLAAEGNIDADVVALRDQVSLQIAADSEEHLELEAASVDAALRGEGLCRGDHLFIVRGEAVIDGALQQHIGQLDVVGVNVGLFWESDIVRLLVGALAETHADAVRDKLLDIGLRTVKV